MILGCTPQHMFCINFSIPSGSSSLFSLISWGKTAQHFFSTFRAIQDPKYTSLVPSMFALPPIAGNLAEGIVVKPWDCETLMDERPIFKIKIQEFQEGEGSAPPPGDPSMKSYLLSQINENRLAAAASKVGPLTDVRGWEECL
jgi:hypothetical protein